MAILGSLLVSSFNEKYEINKTYEFSDLFDLDGKDIPLIEFEEFKGLALQSTFDEEIKIIVECPDSEELLLETREKVTICDLKDVCYVPGTYSISVKYKERIMSFFFRVNPSAMNKNELMDLRKAIDSFQEGLTRELFYKKISDEYAKHDTTIRNEIDFYHQIIANETKLFNQLDKIIQDPIINLKRVYAVSHDQKRSDRKTEQWMETKGKRKNDLFPSETFFLNKKTVQDLSTLENKVLKTSLINFNKKVLMIINRFQDKIEFYKNQITEIDEDIIFTTEMIIGTNVDSERKVLTDQIERRKIEISDFQQKSDLISTYIKRLTIISHTCDQYLFQTWFKDVRVSPSNSSSSAFIANYNYKRSISLMTIKSITKALDGSQRLKELQFRNTPYLFEVYNLLIVHTALLDLGYKAQDSELFTRNYGFVDAIVESTMTYLNEQYKVEVRYDKQIKRKQNHKKSDFYNLNAYSNKPDILVAKWDLQTNQLVDAFIIEVKCVKRYFLVNNYEHTKLNDQFRDYLSLCYLDKTQPEFELKRGIVRKVIVPYPDSDEDAYDLVFKMIEYIGVNPSVPVKNSRIYEELLVELNHS